MRRPHHKRPGPVDGFKVKLVSPSPTPPGPVDGFNVTLRESAGDAPGPVDGFRVSLSEVGSKPGAVEGFAVRLVRNVVVGLPPTPEGQTFAELDFSRRVSGDGVVWYHDFSSDAEVDQFRWTGDVTNPLGNDVLNEGDGTVVRNTSDGVTGGGCLECVVPAGDHSRSGWARPFSPLTGATNGRGSDDPGSGVSLSAWNVVHGTDYLGDWKKGYYAHADNQSYLDYEFDGTEFYISFQAKLTSGRFVSGQPPGKLAFIGVTGKSDTTSHFTPSQELVLASHQNKIIRAYTNFGGNFNSALNDPQEDQDSSGNIKQPGGDWNGTCIDGISCATCACWSVDEWVSVMIHVIPGHHGTSLGDTSAQDTTFEYFIAYPGDTAWRTVYSKSDYVINYSSLTPDGWAVFEPAAYMNSVDALPGQGWSQLYDQIIFSKGHIPVPLTAETALETAANALSSGGSVDFTKCSAASQWDIQWMTKPCYYDPSHREFVFVGKPASGQSLNWSQFIYDEGTDAWTDKGTIHTSTGHNWVNTLDPVTGDYYFYPDNGTDFIWYQRRTDTWSTLAWPYATANNCAALGYHPNLFGPGKRGMFVWGPTTFASFDLEARTWTLNNTFGGGNDYWNCNNGSGDYISGADELWCGSLDANSTPAYWPFIRVLAGAGLESDALAAGKIVHTGDSPKANHGADGVGLNRGKFCAHPGDPSKGLLLECAGNDETVWETSDGGASWTQTAYTHPFDGMSSGSTVGGDGVFAIGSIPEYGVIWGLSTSTSGGDSILWKPPV